MTMSSTTLLWGSLLIVSFVADAGATAYMKVAGDRIGGTGFFRRGFGGSGLCAFDHAVRLCNESRAALYCDSWSMGSGSVRGERPGWSVGIRR